MAKKIRFPLKMENGAEVRNLDDLKENFSVESVVGYFRDGRLLTWLKDRYYESEAEQVAELQDTQPDFVLRLCKIFGQDYEAGVDVEEIRRRQERLNRLKDFTNDPEILDHVDLVAFDQEELSDLLDEDQVKIYLCGDRFAIPASRQGITYIGVNNPKVHISGRKILTAENLDIHFENADVDNFDPVSSQAQKKTDIRETSSVASEIIIPVNEIRKLIQKHWVNLVTYEHSSFHCFVVGDYLLLPPFRNIFLSWYIPMNKQPEEKREVYGSINLKTMEYEDFPDEISQKLPARATSNGYSGLEDIWVFKNRLYHLQGDRRTIICFNVIEKNIEEYVCQQKVKSFVANNNYICYLNEHNTLCIKDFENRMEISPTCDGKEITSYSPLEIDEQSVYCVAGPAPEIMHSDDFTLQRKHYYDIWAYSLKDSTIKRYQNETSPIVFRQYQNGIFLLIRPETDQINTGCLDKNTGEHQNLAVHPDRGFNFEICRSTDAFYCADNKLYMLDFKSREVKLLASDCEYVCSCIGNWLVYAGDNDLRYLIDINHPGVRVIL